MCDQDIPDGEEEDGWEGDMLGSDDDEEPDGAGLLLHRNVQRFREGLVFKAHRLVYHSILGLSVIKK